ncbi:MAG: hypothetical protein M3P46_02155 [Actinomycetota bacterium]|nr:hypothetical protein [Actinomycetota bacterium]
MRLWRELVGTYREPRRMRNLGWPTVHGFMAFLAVLLAVSALTTERYVRGALWVALAVGNAVVALRGYRQRRDADAGNAT